MEAARGQPSVNSVNAISHELGTMSHETPLLPNLPTFTDSASGLQEQLAQIQTRLTAIQQNVGNIDQNVGNIEAQMQNQTQRLDGMQGSFVDINRFMTLSRMWDRNTAAGNHGPLWGPNGQRLQIPLLPQPTQATLRSANGTVLNQLNQSLGNLPGYSIDAAVEERRQVIGEYLGIALC